MVKNSSTLVDLEKGTAALKEEEVEIVDPQRAKLINGLMIVYLALYALFNFGIVAYMVKVSDNGWDLWLCIFILSLTLLGNIWVIFKTKELCIKNYATKRAMESAGDLNAKLLASEK